jgi:hypothetical protein
MHIFRFLLLAAMLVITGCSHGTVVTLSNQSSATLSNVILSGTGFTNWIPSITPGAKERVHVHPSGASGLRVTFDVDGKKFDSGEKDYFESGYRVSAIVHTNLSVTVSTSSGFP